MSRRDVDAEWHPGPDEAANERRVGVGAEMHPEGAGDGGVGLRRRQIVLPDAEGFEQEGAVAHAVAEQGDRRVARPDLDVGRADAKLRELLQNRLAFRVRTDGTEIARGEAG